MKWCIAFLALLQSLYCSGYPMYNTEIASMADRALGYALANVNSMYATNNLYRLTRGVIKLVVPTGQNAAELLLKFGIKETECLKGSGMDPHQCPFKSGFIVQSSACASRVRVSAQVTQVMTLRCGRDGSSSSSESSDEEMPGRLRQQQSVPSYADRNPAPPSAFNPPPAPRYPDRYVHRQEAPTEVQPPPVHHGRAFTRQEEAQPHPRYPDRYVHRPETPTEAQPAPVYPDRYVHRQQTATEVHPAPVYPDRYVPRQERPTEVQPAPVYPDRYVHRQATPTEVHPAPVYPDRYVHRQETPTEVQPAQVYPGAEVPVEAQPHPFYPGGHPFPRQETQPRGDTFSNYLE